MWRETDKADSTTYDGGFLQTDPMALVTLERYWASLTRPGRVADRSDIDPAALGGLIEDCLMLERVAPGVARIRVAGQRVAALTGPDPRGLALGALFDAGSRADLAALTEAAFATPAIVEFPLRSGGDPWQHCLEGRLLILPSRDGFGRINRALAALVLSGRRGQGARRFVLPDDGTRRVQPIRHLTVASGTDRRLAPAPTEKAKRHPTLRLVVNNA